MDHSGNLVGIVLILGTCLPIDFCTLCYVTSSKLTLTLTAEGALRAPATANPPYNMHDALIFHGSFIMAFATLSFFVRARQARRELDEAMVDGCATSPPTASAAVESKAGLSKTLGEVESVREDGRESLSIVSAGGPRVV